MSTSLNTPARTRHAFPDDDRGGDIQRHPGVVPFPVPRRSLDVRLLVADAGLVPRLRDAVDVGAERDHRLARSPFRDERSGNPRDASLNLEAVLLEQAGQVFGRLDLLHAELTEGEDLVDHLLDRLG